MPCKWGCMRVWEDGISLGESKLSRVFGPSASLPPRHRADEALKAMVQVRNGCFFLQTCLLAARLLRVLTQDPARLKFNRDDFSRRLFTTCRR